MRGEGDLFVLGVAFVFPGQGAQFVGMGRELCAAEPVAREALDVASQACGLDLAALCWQGPAETLGETEHLQPALLAVSAAVLSALRARGLRPDAAAGLSLGEYGALLAAGAADLGPLARLVRLRGRFMQEAVPLGEGGMVAVLGLGREEAERLCAAAVARCPDAAPAGGWVLSPANLNCPGQIVLSGHLPAVRAAVALGREFGARRVLPLPVSAPFHCALMAPAARRLQPELEALPLRAAAVPVVGNAGAVAAGAPEDLRAALLEQVDHPVLWEDCVRRLAALGCDTFIEVGPGRTLTGFVGRILPEARAMAVGDPESLERCARELAVR